MSQRREYGVAPPLFQLPDETRVGAAHLQVSDLSHRSSTTSVCSECTRRQLEMTVLY